MAGSRDYRRPPEVCVTVEPDGVSMALDPARSDLLVDAELARFADELPASRPAQGRALEPVRRRFVVTAASLRRGLDRGLMVQACPTGTRDGPAATSRPPSACC